MGPIRTAERLADVLTMIIFTADLASNANKIREANIIRRPYHTPMPDLIPQSINI